VLGKSVSFQSLGKNGNKGGTNWQYDAASTLMSKSCFDVGFGRGVERRL
jgi:hypothetical protein